jgi:hypothetical protein
MSHKVKLIQGNKYEVEYQGEIVEATLQGISFVTVGGNAVCLDFSHEPSSVTFSLFNYQGSLERTWPQEGQ